MMTAGQVRCATIHVRNDAPLRVVLPDGRVVDVVAAVPMTSDDGTEHELWLHLSPTTPTTAADVPTPAPEEPPVGVKYTPVSGPMSHFVPGAFERGSGV